MLSFVIITIDLDTELSVQKDEISQCVGTLNESIDSIHLDASDNNLTIVPPIIGCVQDMIFCNPDNDVLTLHSNRAPPAIL